MIISNNEINIINYKDELIQNFSKLDKSLSILLSSCRPVTEVSVSLCMF